MDKQFKKLAEYAVKENKIFEYFSKYCLTGANIEIATKALDGVLNPKPAKPTKKDK